MSAVARRLALGWVLGSGLLAAGMSAGSASTQTRWDPSYPDFCIAPVSEVGDLDCADIAAGWFTVLPPDPHGFDADYDGYGREAN